MIAAAGKAVWPWAGVVAVWSLPLTVAVLVGAAAAAVWVAAYYVVQARDPRVRTRLHHH